jgi:hypothetical protein
LGVVARGDAAGQAEIAAENQEKHRRLC